MLVGKCVTIWAGHAQCIKAYASSKHNCYSCGVCAPRMSLFCLGQCRTDGSYDLASFVVPLARRRRAFFIYLLSFSFIKNKRLQYTLSLVGIILQPRLYNPFFTRQLPRSAKQSEAWYEIYFHPLLRGESCPVLLGRGVPRLCSFSLNPLPGRKATYCVYCVYIKK